MKRGWREIAGELCRVHATRSCSLVLAEPKQASTFTEVGSHTLQTDGRGINPKQVRKWLWQVRSEARNADGVWSYYDQDRDVSVVGLARV